MGKYHSILLMLFNLAFLMKCKSSHARPVYEKYAGLISEDVSVAENDVSLYKNSPDEIYKISHPHSHMQ